MKTRRLCVLFLASALAAQVTTVSETVDRKLTRVAWFDRTGAAHEVTIEYGQPTWRAEYDAIARTAGTWRLGKDPWTTLYTNEPLRIGETEIAPGWWRLNVARDEQGAWSLLLFMATARTPPGRADPQLPRLRAPLDYTTTDAVAERLTIDLTADETPGKAHLAMHWGGHRLTAAVTAQFELPPPVQMPAFALPAAGTTHTTASGLRYEVLETGAGDAPRDDDTAVIDYVLWREDGTLVDSSYGRGEATSLGLDSVIAGMREGLKLMQPGAVYRFAIPPQLGYGDKAPPAIGNGATLVFHVVLRSVERQ